MVDYNQFGKTFAASRNNMKWEEIIYFFSNLKNKPSILDVGCGSGRLLEQYYGYFKLYPVEYVGIDLSSELIGEARSSFPDFDFRVGNMLELESLVGNIQFDSIFSIASFHHLKSYDDRKSVLKQLYSISQKGATIYMTHWALDSSLNKDKYASSKIDGSENKFGSTDYSVKIGAHTRYYHNFTLKELDTLFKEAGFKILENRLFDNKRNIISILQK
ncbi:class I SAM-dependent methyltransferase [Candidatus Gracilibacteria bacterium]|nr:class I SAM-dependent methyltransferase [Candidatus Gracilibacteria bacterium]